MTDHAQRIADILRDKAREASDERDQIISDTGVTRPSVKWAEAVKQATAELQNRYRAFDAAPVTPERARTRIVPAEYIAVHAEDIAGMQAALCEARERMHRAEAMLAELRQASES